MLSRASIKLYPPIVLQRSIPISSSVPRIVIADPRLAAPDPFRRIGLSFPSPPSYHYCTPRQEAKQKQTNPKIQRGQTIQTWRSYNRQPQIYKSQISYTYLLIGITVAFAVSLFAYQTDSSSPEQGHHETERKAVIDEDNMVALPGRPGNLTPEEEQRLKQFWRMTVNVIGIDIGDIPNLPDTASTINEDISSLAGDKKRKSGGLFGRKKAETKPAGEEDKYGQTKDYQDALASTSPDEFRRALWENCKNEHPDAVLLRFLRARKWDLQKALVMMISTLQWRAKIMKIEEEIVAKGDLAALQDEKNGDAAASKEGSDFLAQFRKGKSYVHGLDREGRPVTWVRVRLHHGGEQSDTSIERFTVQLFETTRLLITPPADTGDLFFDMSGFGMANMDYTPVKFMIRCFEANYPESLGTCLIYKAPWIFQGFWKIINRWLDPVVASKIHFTNSVKDLEPWVERSQIPQEMGGDSPYTYHYIEPREGENDLMKDTATRKKLEAEREKLGAEFERLTIEWVKGANVNAERSELAKRMKQQYWKLDPYVRARTLYDRLGVLGPDGSIDWSRALHPIENGTASKPNSGAVVGSAVGAGAIGAGTGAVAAHSMRKEEDSDTDSIASFKTGNEEWEDSPSLPNGVAPEKSQQQNGFAPVAAVKAGVAATVATVGAGVGAVGASMVNGTSSAHDQPPSTPVKSKGFFSSPISPSKSVRSTYSNAGTQTWNPKDASTQTMPQTLPTRGK